MIIRIPDEDEFKILEEISKAALGEEAFSAGNFKSSFNNSLELLLAVYFEENELEQNGKDKNRAEPFGYLVCSYTDFEAELLQIGVLPEYRKRGAAGLLFKEMVSFLKGKGVEALFLEVRSQNENAKRFYESFGMKKNGTRPGFYKNPGDDALIYRLDLKDA